MRWIIVKMVCHCSYSSIECIPKPSLPERLITAGDAQKKCNVWVFQTKID